MKLFKKFINLKTLLWSIVALLLIWTLAQIDLVTTGNILGGLSAGKIFVLILLNSMIVIGLALRWKIILAGLGHKLPMLAIIRYRLAAFGVSYFTPGPHFGGEPLQVYLVRKNHNVPGTTGLAAVTLDKMFDLIANFTFLAIGFGIVISSDLIGIIGQSRAVALSYGLIFLLVGYLSALNFGFQPVTKIIQLLNIRFADIRLLKKAEKISDKSESEMSDFLQTQLPINLFVVIISVVIWILLISEYWLALNFLGLPLKFDQMIMILLMARISLLSPSPGALGALEAGQVYIIQVLGFDADIGLSMSLLIRARDVTFGTIGLWWGGIGFPGKKKLILP